MSRPIDPADDLPDDGAVDPSIEAALDRVEDEYCSIEASLSALKQFHSCVVDIDPVTNNGTIDSGTPRVLTESNSGGAVAVLDAYRDTFGGLREKSLATRADCLDVLGDEFSDELAENLEYAANQGVFPPTLKANVLNEIAEFKKRFRSAQNALEQERESLEQIGSCVGEIRARLEECQPKVGEQVDFGTLIDRYDEVDGYLDDLDELAAKRQQIINSRTGSNVYKIDHRNLNQLLYRDMTSSYPALREISDCAEDCKEALDAILFDLGLAD